MVNNSKLAQAIFFVAVLALSAVALGAFDEVEARHTESPIDPDPGFSQALVNGTNQLSYRDSSNTSPQNPGSIVPVIDTSTSGSITVTITEVDSNLQATGIDNIFANITSTAQPAGLVFQLDEDAVNSSVFEGVVQTSSGFEPGKLRVFSTDDIQVFYEPQHDGVGRLSATLINATDGRVAQLQDFTIDDPDGFNTRVIQACPYDLVVHPVEILIPITTIAEAADAINVTISYANAVDVGPSEKYCLC